MMSLLEQTSYQVYLSELSDDAFDKEVTTVIRQDRSFYPDTAMLIQHCINEYERRGKKDKFISVYNEAIK